MFILKWIIVLCIISICSYLGVIKSKTFENRVIELKKIYNALNMFKSKIEFTHEPIKDIFEDISLIIYKRKDNIFENSIEKMKNENVSIAWSNAVEEEKNDLIDEDKEILKSFGKLLGKTDIAGQVNEINLTENLLESQIIKAENEKNKNVKLYKTLGIVIGCGISIILI